MDNINRALPAPNMRPNPNPQLAFRNVKARKEQVHNQEQADLRRESAQMKSEVAQTMSQLAQAQTQLKTLTERLDALETRKTVDYSRDVEGLKTKVAGLESTSEQNRTELNRLNQTLPPRIKTLETRKIVDHSSDVRGLKTNVAGLESALEQHQTELHYFKQTLSPRIEAIETRIQDLDTKLSELVTTAEQHEQGLRAKLSEFEQGLRTKLSEFEQVFRANLSELSTAYGKCQKELNDLKNRKTGVPAKDIQASAPKLSTLETDAQELKREVYEKLRPEVNDCTTNIITVNDDLNRTQSEVHTLANDVRAIQVDVPKIFKADLEKVQKTTQDKFDIVNMAIRHLEARYENIITEELYQHMVHWIAQMYPNAPDFLNKLNSVQHMLSALQGAIFTLQHEISTIKTNTNTLRQGSHDIKADATLMDGRIKSLEDLPPAINDVKAIATSMDERIKCLEDLPPAINDVKASATSMDERIKCLENLPSATSDIQEKLDEVAQEVRGLNIAEFKGFTTFKVQVTIAIKQIQQVVSSINESLDHGGLNIQWDSDALTLMKALNAASRKNP